MTYICTLHSLRNLSNFLSFSYAYLFIYFKFQIFTHSKFGIVSKYFLFAIHEQKELCNHYFCCLWVLLLLTCSTIKCHISSCLQTVYGALVTYRKTPFYAIMASIYPLSHQIFLPGQRAYSFIKQIIARRTKESFCVLARTRKKTSAEGVSIRILSGILGHLSPCLNICKQFLDKRIR